MTKIVAATAHKRSMELGGTKIAIHPILTALTLMDHILLMLMASTGKNSEVTPIL